MPLLRRREEQSIEVQLAPMADIGFLLMCFFLICLNDNISSVIHFNNILLPFVKNYKVKNVILILMIVLMCILTGLNVDPIYILFWMALSYPICFIVIPLFINVRLVPGQDLGEMLYRSSLVAIFSFLALYCALNSDLINKGG